MKHKLSTVGILREAVKDYPDDTVIITQVCGTSGDAWNLCGSIAEIPASRPLMLQIALRHPDLVKLPEWQQPEAGDD